MAPGADDDNCLFDGCSKPGDGWDGYCEYHAGVISDHSTTKWFESHQTGDRPEDCALCRDAQPN